MVDMKFWKEYYSNSSNLEKISYQCRFREVVIIKHTYEKKVVIRPFKIFKPEHFQWIYKFLSLDKVPFDIYISNASVKLPKLPSNIKDLANARHRLNMIWKEIMTGYDFFVDCDASTEEDEPQLIEWAKQIIKDDLMPKGKVDIWATGSGGIHCILKGKFEPNFVKEKVESICDKHGFPLRFPTDKDEDESETPFVDNSIYDLRRIRRVGWSIHSKTGNVMEKVI